jgi:hypothetical protein
MSYGGSRSSPCRSLRPGPRWVWSSAPSRGGSPSSAPASVKAPPAPAAREAFDPRRDGSQRARAAARQDSLWLAACGKAATLVELAGGVRRRARWQDDGRDLALGPLLVAPIGAGGLDRLGPRARPLQAHEVLVPGVPLAPFPLRRPDRQDLPRPQGLAFLAARELIRAQTNVALALKRYPSSNPAGSCTSAAGSCTSTPSATDSPPRRSAGGASAHCGTASLTLRGRTGRFEGDGGSWRASSRVFQPAAGFDPATLGL